MRYIFDTNFYRNSVIEYTDKQLEVRYSNQSYLVLFPSIVSIELINRLTDTNTQLDCSRSLRLLFMHSSKIQNGNASGTIVSTFYDLLTLYFFSKKSKNFNLANKTFLMTKSVYEGKHNTKEFLKDVESVIEFKKNELSSIISNLEKYLSSISQKGEINWKIFQESTQFKKDFLDRINNKSLNKLVGLALFKLATEEVDNPVLEITKEKFENQFMKHFEISIDFFVNYILKKLVDVNKVDYLKYPETDPKRRWNSFYDFQLIFATEFENLKGQKTIFVTQDAKIRKHFKKFDKEYLTKSLKEFKEES